MTSAATGFASAWIDVLLRESLLVVVVFCVVALMARCGRRIGPAFHVALWSLVFIRLLLPPGLSHPFSVGRILGAVSPSEIAMAVGRSGPAGGETGVAGADHGIADSDRRLAQTGSLAVAAAWLVGSLTVFAVYRRRRSVFHRIVRSAQEVSDPQIEVLVEAWRRRLGVRRRVRVLSSGEKVSPFTTGVFLPVILVPRSVLSAPRCLEPVIAHEMAHIASFDALWLHLQHLIQSLYFFHPLVWISGVRLNEERERLADATAVSAGCLSASEYVGGLLNVLRLDLQGAGAPTMSSRKRRIGVRIQKILDREGHRRPQTRTVVVAVFLLGVFLLPLGGDGATIASDNVEPTTKSSPAAGAVDADFVNPLPSGRVTWTWGPGKKDPLNANEEVFHRGIDLAAKAGTPVLATADGVVMVATESYEKSPASGTVVIVDHGQGLTSVYSHLESFAVREGQRVSQNEVIATVGSTGKSTGPHLHFEVREDGESRNPADYVQDWKS